MLWTLDESIESAKRLEDLSLVDFFTSAIGTYYNLYLSQASMHNPVGLKREKVASLKSSVHVPVLAGNRIHTPEMAEHILETGQADMIGWIRPLICDPRLPVKIREGRTEDIVYCVSDNQNCVSRVARSKPVACIQNPWAGRETEIPEVQAHSGKSSKRVMVVGAGPAGLQAGLTAARLGHEVVIHEKESEPGGQLRFARLGAGRQEIWKVVENLMRRLDRHDVSVLTESPVDEHLILSEAPDAVVVATGSFPNPRPGTWKLLRTDRAQRPASPSGA